MTATAVEVPAMYHRRGIACQHRTYYLTCEDFDALWVRAGGCCQICKTPELETKRGLLCIDHMSEYGYGCVRGLLCDKCNSLMRRVDEGRIRFRPGSVMDYQRNSWFALHVMYSRGFYVNRKNPRWEWSE